jgi:trehalose 6-phosphate phosphatase
MAPEVAGASLVDALKRAAEVLSSTPSALVTDIDGTISRIVARPEDATVSEQARSTLAGLAESLDLVAVITAREASIARDMVGLDGIAYVGNYAVDGATHSLPDPMVMERLKAQAVRLIDELPCVTLEEKGISFALHYRNCGQPEEMRLRLLDALQPLTRLTGARLLEGKRVVEAVPASLPDKGVAFAHLADGHGIKGIVYLGDDLSDIAVFQEIAVRREKGLPGLGVAVVDAETDATVALAADQTLYGVDGVEQFLSALLLDVKGARR